ncbi:hypothetical protein [Microcoleus sp. PH2017_34_RAT_O_A]
MYYDLGESLSKMNRLEEAISFVRQALAYN